MRNLKRMFLAGSFLGQVFPPPPPPFGTLPMAIRDQGMGATDAGGMVAAFPLNQLPSNGLFGGTAGVFAKQVFVDSTNGSSGYNGLSPFAGFRMNGTGPYYQFGATGPGVADAAYGPGVDATTVINSVAILTWQSNQYFFAEGGTYVLNSGINWTFRGVGRGYPPPSIFPAQFPTTFQSYDPRDPLNTAKHGRAGTGSQGARPVFTLGTSGSPTWPVNTSGGPYDYGGWVFRGLVWLTTGNGTSVSWQAAQSNLLYENMIFNNVGLGFNHANTNPGFTTSSNVIVRFCASYGQYDTAGSHACGIFAASTNITIEDCVFWHCGWKVGASRDDPVSAGGPDQYKHCLYLDSPGTTVYSKVHRNVMIDGSAAGLSMRGSHVCHHNVIIDCPTPDFKSGGSGSDTESPNGVSQHDYCELILGGASISSAAPRWQGFSSSDGTIDSYLSYSLFANNPGYGLQNNNWLQVLNLVPAQISYMGFHHNRAYAFAHQNDPYPYRLVVGPTNLASITITADEDNVISPTSPMTNAQIYAAIGFADTTGDPYKGGKDAMVAAMIADPTQPWAYRLLAVASVGFSFDFNQTMA